MQTFLGFHHTFRPSPQILRGKESEEALRITAWEASQIPELKTQCKDPLRANVYFLQFTQKMKPLMINDSKN